MLSYTVRKKYLKKKKKSVLGNLPPSTFIFQSNVIKGSASLAHIYELPYLGVFQLHIKYKVRDNSQCHGHYAHTQLCQSIWTHTWTC